MRAVDNRRGTSCRLIVNGKLVKRTTGATPTLGVRTGRFQIVAVDAAGNLSKDSIAVVVARGTGKGHPYTTAR